MAKASKGRAAVNKPTAEVMSKEGTATLSVRLTEAQQELLARAARLRNWTPTHFLRVAALERAAHVINASPDYVSNLAVPAMNVARRLVERPTAYTIDLDDFQRIPMDVVHDLVGIERDMSPGDNLPVEISPRELSEKEWDDFQRAARLGGAEFLALIVAAARLHLSPPGGPTPIDPDQFSEKE
jgi:hypothetical protein